jgi:hypothetical protein
MKSPLMIISQPNADFLALAVAMSPATLSMTDIGLTFALNGRSELGA